ncbi:hypothetical protein [uncultured Alistipes sp.]|uniref:hypothetical protein n=1 Tax=uncultured Alistipes sp. TaxID=538949 RepID=UPI0026196D16|nr:hypothetical protein [uncultured Alistipes sp.]
MKQFYSTGLRLLSWTALCAGVITSSCKKDDSNNGGGGGEPTPPPVTLNDQIEYNGGDLIDIKSAVYAVDEENANLFTFYLSPTEGIKTVKEMEAADDYLKVSVENPAGTVDTKNQLFSIDYEDISVSKTSMVGYANVNLSVNLLEQTSRLVLYVDVKTESGETLLARYNNNCTLYKLPTLNNQYGIDDQVKTIGSVVEWVDLEAGTTTYYVYEKEGVTAPSEETPAGLTIQLASDLDPEQIVNGRLVAGSKLEIDFSTADMQKVSVQSGTFQSESGMAGTLTLQKDRTDISKLAVKLDIKGADQRLRANYTYGTVNPAYKSSDHLKVSVTDDAVMDGDLTELFNYFQTGVHQFAFGIPATDPEESKEGVAALTTGRYAVQINVAEANLGKTLDLSKSGEVGLFVYDYETYKTYDASKMDVTGTVRVIDAGSNNYYLSVDAVFQDGPTVKGEWFGSVTTEDSAFSEILTPVEPYSPTIVVRAEDETELLRKTLERVEVRMEKDYKLNGGPQWGGAQFDAYFFYFVPEGALEYNDIEAVSAVPQFMIPASFIPTPGESLNLGANTDAEDLHWLFKYTAESYLQYGYNGYSNAGNSTLLPNTASVSIAKNETDNTWKITFILADSGTNYGFEVGSKNVITIDWEGPLTKYSGTKKNDLEDSFYGN